MKYKIVFLLFLYSAVSFAQKSRFSENETLYVWALNGLNMRKLPDAKSEKIAALPYGEKVTVQANIGIIVAHEVEEFKDFKVHGVWLLVKYGDKEGFVFDGYLSRLVAPEKNRKYSVDAYIKQNYKKIGKPSFSTYIDPNTIITITKKEYKDHSKGDGWYSYFYSSGIKDATSFSENASGGETFFDNSTLYEGYIFAKTIFSDIDFQYDKSDKKFILDDNETCQFGIFMKGKKLIIKGGCNC